MGNKVTDLPVIANGERPKVLLVGNGINRAFGSCDSASEMIRKAMTRNGTAKHEPYIDNLPFPMRMVIATNNDVHKEMAEITRGMCSATIPDEQKDYIKGLLALGFDAVLTTNYSLEIEKTVFGNDWKPRYNYTIPNENTRKHFCNYRYTLLPLEKTASLWHIHGTANNYNTTVIGHYYYGKLLSDIKDHVGSLIYRLAVSKKGFRPTSWIDYFLLGDVYVIGFNADLTESDIWWLLDYKSRYNAKLNGAKTIIYNSELSKEKSAMLEAYGCVIMDSIKVEPSAAYRNYYYEVLRDINK